MEVTQFTYFQQVGGIECAPVAVELTYGLERLAMYIQGVENVYDLDWDGLGTTYGDVFLQAEREGSAYNFEHADTAVLFRHFADAEAECKICLDAGLRSAGLRPVHQGEPPASTCWTRAASSASPSAPPTSAGSGRWPGAAAKPGCKAAGTGDRSWPSCSSSC